MLDRLRRDAAIACSIAGPLVLVYLLLVYGGHGHDTFSYWRVPHGPELYSGSADPGGQGVYRYSPVIAQVLAPFWILPWEAFRLLWFLLGLACLVWLAGRWSLLLLALPPVWFELYTGNIHLPMAAAIALGFRFPAAWSFLLLTKVTPFVGALWFVFRREWPAVAMIVGFTASVVIVSVALAGLAPWLEWLASLQSAQTAEPWPIPLPPLPIRVGLAAGLVAWGARTGRYWTVPAAATIALPVLWGHGLTLLLAALRVPPTPVAEVATPTAAPPLPSPHAIPQ
jgi:hypothetical protein